MRIYKGKDFRDFAVDLEEVDLAARIATFLDGLACLAVGNHHPRLNLPMAYPRCPPPSTTSISYYYHLHLCTNTHEQAAGSVALRLAQESHLTEMTGPPTNVLSAFHITLVLRQNIWDPAGVAAIKHISEAAADLRKLKVNVTVARACPNACVHAARYAD